MLRLPKNERDQRCETDIPDKLPEGSQRDFFALRVLLSLFSKDAQWCEIQ